MAPLPVVSRWLRQHTGFVCAAAHAARGSPGSGGGVVMGRSGTLRRRGQIEGGGGVQLAAWRAGGSSGSGGVMDPWKAMPTRGLSGCRLPHQEPSSQRSSSIRILLRTVRELEGKAASGNCLRLEAIGPARSVAQRR